MATRFPRIAIFFACVLALQLTPGCTESLAASVPANPAKAAPAGPALWEVADKDTTIYLFGTIHFLPKDIVWLRGNVEQALKSSDELVTEIDSSQDSTLADLMAQRAYLPAGENLRDRLDQKDREALEGLLISLGIAVDQFDRYKPWSAGLYLSVLMTRIAGFDPEQGVEKVVQDHARPDASRAALETIEFQVNLFNSLPDRQQIGYLNQVVASAPTQQSDLDQMLNDWLDGDAKALARLINSEESDPVLYRRLLTDRNANWARWIKERMKQPGTVFIAVGAGHLAGKGSVQDKLRSLGFRAKRVR